MLNVIKYKLQGRSNLWSKMRVQYLKLSPYCAACDSDNKLEVHHIRPFHLHPELELEASNLVTLCKYCHLVLGHLKDYTYYNVSVLDDCQKFKDKRREFNDGGKDRD